MIENIEQVHEFTQGFTEAVNKRFPELQLKFILHHRGQRNDAIEMARSHLDLHPAGSIAMNILRKTKSTQKSGFHGLAIETQMKWFGFKKSDPQLALLQLTLTIMGQARLFWPMSITMGAMLLWLLSCSIHQNIRQAPCVALWFLNAHP